MLRGFLLVGLVVVVGCSPGGGDASAIGVAIDDVDVSGSMVTLTYTIEGAGEGSSIRVEWGDGSAEPAFEGNGAFLVTHEYATDVVSAFITVQATSQDGAVASDVTQVELSPPTNTTSTSTTSTTIPPTTTTIAATTTTLQSTTTTSEDAGDTTTTTSPATTTTALAEPESVKFDLVISSGEIIDRYGDGLNESDWDGSVAEAKVQRHDDSWEVDGIKVEWQIPRDQYLSVLENAATVAFSFAARTRIDYELDTDRSDGNEAAIVVDMRGSDTFVGSSSDTFRESIEEDDRAAAVSFRTLSGNWATGSPNSPQSLVLTLECRAKGPGGILVTSDSECDAEVSFEFIEVTVTGIPQGG